MDFLPAKGKQMYKIYYEFKEILKLLYLTQWPLNPKKQLQIIKQFPLLSLREDTI